MSSYIAPYCDTIQNQPLHSPHWAWAVGFGFQGFGLLIPSDYFLGEYNAFHVFAEFTMGRTMSNNDPGLGVFDGESNYKTNPIRDHSTPNRPMQTLETLEKVAGPEDTSKKP